MKRLKSVETDQYSLEVIECDCGYHMGIDATFLEQVDDFVTKCPSCGKKIKTAKVCPEDEKPVNPPMGKKDTFICPLCEEEKPISCRVLKGCCRSCSSSDC